jgi:hypothetical protein
MQDAVGASAIEAALYRAMQLPEAETLYPRPPAEARGELNDLIGKAPDDAALYSLRALEEEQALDFRAAEADWNAFGAHAKDHIGAELELADYYHRRLAAQDEVQVLMKVGSSAPQPEERYTAPSEQRSWKAFERILPLVEDQGLGDEAIVRAYAAWITRYPEEFSVRARVSLVVGAQEGREEV